MTDTQAAATPRWARTTLLVLGATALFAFLAVALLRITYPYELEFMTGACLDHVDRVLDGEPLYVPPTADFVTWLYGPLYFYTAAAVSWLVGGSSLVVLRVVSLTAAVATTALVYRFVHKRTDGDRFAAWTAMGLWASTYGIVGTWWDIGRVDSLFVTWTMLALALLMLGKKTSTAVLAALVLTLAYLTKQTALVLAPPFAIAAAFYSVRRAVWFAVVFAIAWIDAVLVLDALTDGWFHFYTFETPKAHGYELAAWWEYFPSDTARILPMVVASAWYVVHLLRTHRARAALAVGAWCSSLWLATNLSRAHVGGAENVLIPTHLGFAIVTGLALAEARHCHPWRIVIPLLAIAQFACSAYRPWHYLPTAADRAAGDALVAVLEATEGPVMLPHHGHYARRTGHAPAAHVLAVMDIERGPDPELGAQLRADFLRWTWDNDCELVILDEPTDMAFMPLLVRDPTKLEWTQTPLFEEELDAAGNPALQWNGRPVFMPVVGLQARPKQVWRRKR